MSELALNLATIRGGWGLAEAIEGCQRHGVHYISPWRDQIQSIGLDAAARLVRASGVAIEGLCRGGMFPSVTAEGRRAAIEDNFRAIDEAAALGARCLVLVVGTLPPESRDLVAARKMVAEGIAAILPRARAADVAIAIEPLHPMYAADRACINTIDQALDLCEALGEGAGVAIDTYHTWWDPNLSTAIARAGRLDRILMHHISDWLVPTKDMLLDRGMMGDGIIDFRGFRAMIEAAGYNGPQEVEIFSRDDWWERSGDEILIACRERFIAHCLPSR
ncbi:MAG: sugar phosphate isomerase/epimerase family protein [Devosia sp.]